MSPEQRLAPPATAPYNSVVEGRVWARKLRIAEAERAEREYYAAMSPEQRLEVVQELRELASRFGYESRKGLRRLLTVVKRT